jgi:hypothetical protein
MRKRQSPYEVRREMIKDIMDDFDFEKCRKVMLALDWEWWGQGTPSIKTMKESATNRLNDAVEGVLNRENNIRSDVPYMVSSGGFKAIAYKNRYGYLDFLKLEFVVTDWEATQPDY